MRRLLRIGPTYWLYTTVLTIVIVGFPGIALVLLLGARWRAPCVAAVLSCLAAAGWFFPPTGPVLHTYTCPLALEFAFGAFIGHAYRSCGRRRGWFQHCHPG